LDDAPFVNTFSEEFQADPGAAVDALRDESWILRTALGGLVIGRAQVQALLADRRLRSAITDVLVIQGVTEGPLHREISGSILALEGADHLRIRKLVNRAFTPRAVDVHRPHMRDTLHQLLEPVLAGGRFDFVTEIADHYPIQVMCHVLGVPEEDHENFAAWNQAITWALSFQVGVHRDEIEWGLTNLNDYVSGLVADRRRDPGEDMISALVQAQEADDRLSDHEVRTMIAALLFAGYDTTRNQLGLALWLFARHPEQWRILADEPDLAAQAVEEVMRFHGAVSVVPRMVAEDLDLDGYAIPKGTVLMLSTAAANQDPSAFAAPRTFDITVPREPQLTFGGGPHYCLGAALARAEMQEALRILAAHLPGLALDGEPVWRQMVAIYGPDSLPIRFTPSTVTV
jgi:cytochrome P450